MTIRITDREHSHRLHLSVHWKLRDASEALKSLLIELHIAEVGSYENDRIEAKESILSYEGVRQSLDHAIKDLANAYHGLLHHTGCDGSCSSVEVDIANLVRNIPRGVESSAVGKDGGR